MQASNIQNTQSSSAMERLMVAIAEVDAANARFEATAAKARKISARIKR